MTRRPGAQRKGKCWLIAARLLRAARVTRVLFSFCWPEKQGAYTSHAKSAPEKQGAYTSHAKSAQSLLHAQTAPDNAAWPDFLGRSGRKVRSPAATRLHVRRRFIATCIAKSKHCTYALAFGYLILDSFIQMRRGATAKFRKQIAPYITCGTRDI